MTTIVLCFRFGCTENADACVCVFWLFWTFIDLT